MLAFHHQEIGRKAKDAADAAIKKQVQLDEGKKKQQLESLGNTFDLTAVNPETTQIEPTVVSDHSSPKLTVE